jgi:hypothetical protein
MTGELENLRKRLADVTAELARMPRYLVGSGEWTDRINRRDRLRRTISRLELEARYVVRK